MDKNECLKLMNQYFHIESLIVKLKNPDFKLKSHIFYYNNIFKEVDKIAIMQVRSKNLEDDILFNIYYVSDEFESLFHGYFSIEPLSKSAQKIFRNISKVCTDLGTYFYYAYQNSDLLKKYLIAGNFQNSLEESDDDLKKQLDEIKKEMYIEISQYETKKLEQILLRRDFLRKYIKNFIKFNEKPSEEVKMFLMSILTRKMKNHICFMNNEKILNTFIHIDTKSITLNKYKNLSIYGLMDHAVEENYILFLKLEFDFEGGDNIGKIIG
ncbi:hypothetical protein [Crassaminicella profunda]|uniref:hypothetical protein n=1 Tax=Crassaminicella profunda TaxID=1286698 RepID=UPI001CA68492|nr:hypothetical protein [Crassaminicella profunda]QZY55437.1 hypothetical protein K7H06_20985 [Crassaminicella profunda]